MGKLKHKIIIGQRFGKLVVIAKINPIKDKDGVFNRSAKAKCDCGIIIKRPFDSLRRMTSCGCARIIYLQEHPPKKTHALTKHPLYRRWQEIKRRCREVPTKRKIKGYEHYGGNGIRICKSWENNFMAFYKWAMVNGFSKELWIDRIKNSKGYSPSNCRWVTIPESNRNTSKNIYVDGVCLKDYCEKNNLPYKSIFARIKYYGYSIKKAISIPVRKISVFNAQE